MPVFSPTLFRDPLQTAQAPSGGPFWDALGIHFDILGRLLLVYNFMPNIE